MWQDSALMLGGAVGVVVGIFHGSVVQRVMVGPIGAALAGTDVRVSARRLVSPIMHVSTAVYILGGLALIAIGAGWAPYLRTAVALTISGFYLHAMVMNCWATRGRHPGWMLMAAALVLIQAGVWL